MNESIIEFAFAHPDVAVIKVHGRGSFLNSMDLQSLTDTLRKKNPNIRFIIDLEHCITLDSTFMGTLAGISIEQNKAGMCYLTVVNAQKHTRQLLVNLGLSYILDMREMAESMPVREEDFQKAEGEQASRFEQIVHMIKAHNQLIDLDTQNEIRFQSVIKYLQDSLEREKKKKEDTPDSKT